MSNPFPAPTQGEIARRSHAPYLAFERIRTIQAAPSLTDSELANLIEEVMVPITKVWDTRG